MYSLSCHSLVVHEAKLDESVCDGVMRVCVPILVKLRTFM